MDLKETESPGKDDRTIVTKDLVYQRQFLGRTISGLPIPVITLTARRHLGVAFKKR